MLKHDVDDLNWKGGTLEWFRSLGDSFGVKIGLVSLQGCEWSLQWPLLSFYYWELALQRQQTECHVHPPLDVAPYPE